MKEILENAAGRVFRADVDGEELLRIKEKYLVTGMLKQGDHTTVRFLSETPPDVKGSSPDEANCEDAYLYCLCANAMNAEVRGRGAATHGRGMEMPGSGGEAHEKGAADRKVSAGNAAAGRKTGGEKTCF